MENGGIITDDTEAEYVRLIFKLRAQGKGVCDIGKKLYNDRIPFFFRIQPKKPSKRQALYFINPYMQGITNSPV